MALINNKSDDCVIKVTSEQYRSTSTTWMTNVKVKKGGGWWKGGREHNGWWKRAKGGGHMIMMMMMTSADESYLSRWSTTIINASENTKHVKQVKALNLSSVTSNRGYWVTSLLSMNPGSGGEEGWWAGERWGAGGRGQNQGDFGERNGAGRGKTTN